jgi:branched-chain amino acid transport system permease protein
VVDVPQQLAAVTTQFVIQNVVDAMALGFLYAQLALGLALIFGVMGLLNWAHGEMVMAGGYAVVVFAGLVMPLIVFLTLAAVIVLALLMERVAFRPVRLARPEAGLITSFGVSFLLQNVAYMIFGATPRTASVSAGLLEPVSVLGVDVAKLSLITVGTGIVMLVGVSVLLARTTLGIQLRAASADFQMARLLGVRANRVIATAFAIAGLLAGVTAFLLISQTGTVYPTSGFSPVLVAFTAVIIGGMGSLLGGAVGGFLVGVLSVGLQALLPGSLDPFRDAFLFGIVFMTLVVRPQGLIVPKHVVNRI